jgi:hypothetical protein
MANQRWYIARNNEKVGPFAPMELKQLSVFGLVKPVEMLLLEGTSKWVEASSVPWLFPTVGQKKFTLKLLGQTRGPYSIEQIRAALTTKEITLDTMAQTDDTQPWSPLRQHDEFRDFVAPNVTESRAQVFMNSLDIEEASLHLAGKNGDMLAKLISNLLDKQRAHAKNPALSENIEATIRILKAKRDEITRANG